MKGWVVSLSTKLKEIKSKSYFDLSFKDITWLIQQAELYEALQEAIENIDSKEVGVIEDEDKSLS